MLAGRTPGHGVPWPWHPNFRTQVEVMAESSVTEPAGESVGYRPISGPALAGFVLSCLFVAVVVISTAVALAQGLPVFLPSEVLWLAAIAAGTCFLGFLHIRNADGTRAGARLARWGLWLSVLIGATYFVYIWVTGLALAKQADDFLMIKSSDDTGFFPRLENAARNRTDLYQAFLLSLPATSRGGSRAADEAAMLAQYDQPGKDGEPGNIAKFTRHPIVLNVFQNGDAVKIEPLGVVEWKYERNSYYLTRNYRFTTPEMVVESPVPVQSTEGAGEGEQRKWFVNVMRIPNFKEIKLTPLGRALFDLRSSSKSFLQHWHRDLGDKARVPQYDDADAAWAAILPKKTAERDHVRKEVAEIFRGERNLPVQTTINTDEHFAPWTKDGERVQIHHPLKMMIPAEAGFPHLNVELDVLVESKNPVALSGPVKLPIPWELRSIRVTRAAPAPRKGGPLGLP